MIRRTMRSWGARAEVIGGSMRPQLRSGDWLLVDPEAYAATGPAVGDLVLVPDPREPTRLLVKRVSDVYEGGRELWVRGDARDATSDSEVFGSVRASTVVGRPWFRYWPLSRLGRVV
jgi:nickel-type superoxide dismutase maturation protease